MKLIKLALIILLFGFLFTTCAAPNQFIADSQQQEVFDRQQHEPDEFKQGDHKEFNFYLKRSSWDSPFNPHEVLRYWVHLDAAAPSGPNITLGLVGNPKADWTNRARIKDPAKIPIPEGEIAAAVLFVFVRVPSGIIELAGYGYRDKNGVVNFYGWNKEAMKYTRKVNKPSGSKPSSFNKDPGISVLFI